MVGAYLSHFKGRGMDFEELREYIPGDEVRDIDWNVTYRMGRPFVKRYREERELAHGPGGRYFRFFGFRLAAPRQTRVRGGNCRHARHFRHPQQRQSRPAPVHRSSRTFLPPRKGRRHILRLIREMLFFEPKHTGTNIPAGLAFLNHVLHRRSIVFLLTDFLHSFGERVSSADRNRQLRDAGCIRCRKLG